MDDLERRDLLAVELARCMNWTGVSERSREILEEIFDCMAQGMIDLHDAGHSTADILAGVKEVFERLQRLGEIKQ